MKYLIVSDIHANLEGLSAVLEMAAGQYDEIVCCGDLVGYGASPNEVCNWARENCTVVVRGNHDKACCGLDDLSTYTQDAAAAAMWTAEMLTAENMEWLRSLPQGPIRIEGSFDLVHGAPYGEDEYILTVEDLVKARDSMQAPLVFFGHTHLQYGYRFREDGCFGLAMVRPDREIAVTELEEGGVYLINPGSVGQPRDRDWRAGFASYDSSTGRLAQRRAAYDIRLTQHRILDAGLPWKLAQRLVRGL